VIEESALAVVKCEHNLVKERNMLKTWCTSQNIRIGQCEDEIYICLCSSPGDFETFSESSALDE